MENPYYDTNLEVDVRLEPRHMNNNILEHIRESINRKYIRKCYKDYGYITSIYGIQGEIRGGVIRAEDSTSSSLHKVRFKCKLCNPLINSSVVAKITGINMMLLIAETGPIKIIISSQNINRDNIVYMSSKSAYFPRNSSGDVINRPLQAGTYIMVRLISKKIVNGEDRIITIGILESVATEEEIKRSLKYEYEEQIEIEAEKYIDQDNRIKENKNMTTDTDTSTATIESSSAYE